MSGKWWTLMMTSRTPKELKRVRVISRSVRPATSTRALGRVSVSGRRRVPSPAARIMAFIGGLSFFHLFQFEMAHDDFEAVPEAQAFGQLLREKNRAVLAARAAEGNHQILEAALLIVVYGGVQQRKHAGEE